MLARGKIDTNKIRFLCDIHKKCDPILNEEKKRVYLLHNIYFALSIICALKLTWIRQKNAKRKEKLAIA